MSQIVEKQTSQIVKLILMELRKLLMKTWQFPLVGHLKQASVKSLPKEDENIGWRFVDHLIQPRRIVGRKRIQLKVLYTN